MPEEKNDKLVYARVAESMLTALDEAVKAEREDRPGVGISRSDLIREALSEFLTSRNWVPAE